MERSGDETRSRILTAAFQEIYLKGFQGMRLDDVLQHTGLTKGALYHHFPNKMALGYAVVEEVIAGTMAHIWLVPLAQAEEPLDTVIQIITELMDNDGPMDITELGCPLNNLAQEMSPLDEGFRLRLDRIFQAWHDGLLQALKKGQAKGKLRADVDCERTTVFIIAVIEGCIGMAKNAQSRDRLQMCGQSLIDYLNSLRS